MMMKVKKGDAHRGQLLTTAGAIGPAQLKDVLRHSRCSKLIVPML